MIKDNQLTIRYNSGNQVIELIIAGDENNPLIEPDDALEYGEAPFQIFEGCRYDYTINKGFRLEKSEIVTPSKINASNGTISPNIYIGTLTLQVFDDTLGTKTQLKLEVRSKKTNREEYRRMLSDITDHCTELLFQFNSPTSQLFTIDFEADSKIVYQRFAFLKSILESPEFTESLNKILSSPVTNWKETESSIDIRNAKKLDNKSLRQIAGARNRMELPESHPLKETIKSVPAHIQSFSKTKTVDTPENRFIKFVLNAFRSFMTEFVSKVQSVDRVKREAQVLERFLDEFLSHSVFKEIGNPTTLPLNSPVLQRKEGYREILRAWLMFDLAAKLIWSGGDDVYEGDKKDVATLYEYWLFFKLLDILKEQFEIEPKSVDQLISESADGMCLMLKQGRHIPLQGVYKGKSRTLHVQFSYNRTFKGHQSYPRGGSWSMDMRPDYTLSLWPFGIKQEQAEEEELIVHVHFDAKYRIDNLRTIFGDLSDQKKSEDELQEELSLEKTEQILGNAKRVDLLKMHAYKDAIRRTAGAYVLYPGSKQYRREGFHEIIPGLGAFAIKPTGNVTEGESKLKEFLKDITEHLMDRISDREIMSFRTYQTYQPEENSLKDRIPESQGENRFFFPYGTSVLLGFIKNPEHLEWVLNSRKYNVRTGDAHGAVPITSKLVDASYILLYGPGESMAHRLFKLGGGGAKLYSKAEMIKLEYPNPQNEYYLVFDKLESAEPEFDNYRWDITQLDEYHNEIEPGQPFAVSLTKLMRVAR